VVTSLGSKAELALALVVTVPLVLGFWFAPELIRYVYGDLSERWSRFLTACARISFCVGFLLLLVYIAEVWRSRPA